MSFKICVEHSGYTCIRGASVDQAVEKLIDGLPANTEAFKAINHADRRHSGYHITMLSKDEARKANEPLFPEKVCEDLHFVGVGSIPAQEFHIVVLCPAANHIRVKLGLPVKDLHVTLTGKGENGNKSIDSLLSTYTATDGRTSLALAKHFLLLPDRRSEAIHHATTAAALSSDDPLLFSSALLVAASAAELIQHPLTMALFAAAWEHGEGSLLAKQKDKIVRSIVDAGAWREFGPVFIHEAQGSLEPLDLQEVPTLLRTTLAAHWSIDLKNAVALEFAKRRLDSPWLQGSMWTCERGSKLLVPLRSSPKWHKLPRCFVSGTADFVVADN